jgi:hypothetical protein
MRFLNIALLSATGLSALGNALGYAKVINDCSYPIYLWSVSNVTGPEVTLKPGMKYHEQFSTTHGVAIKITTVPGGIFNGSPEIDFGYTVGSQGLFYDLTDVNGDPFNGKSGPIVPSDSSCPTASLGQGTVFCSDINTDLTLTPCGPGTSTYFEDNGQRYED